MKVITAKVRSSTTLATSRNLPNFSFMTGWACIMEARSIAITANILMSQPGSFHSSPTAYWNACPKTPPRKVARAMIPKYQRIYWWSFPFLLSLMSLTRANKQTAVIQRSVKVTIGSMIGMSKISIVGWPESDWKRSLSIDSIEWWTHGK